MRKCKTQEREGNHLCAQKNEKETECGEDKRRLRARGSWYAIACKRFKECYSARSAMCNLSMRRV